MRDSRKAHANILQIRIDFLPLIVTCVNSVMGTTTGMVLGGIEGDAAHFTGSFSRFIGRSWRARASRHRPTVCPGPRPRIVSSVLLAHSPIKTLLRNRLGSPPTFRTRSGEPARLVLTKPFLPDSPAVNTAKKPRWVGRPHRPTKHFSRVTRQARRTLLYNCTPPAAGYTS